MHHFIGLAVTFTVGLWLLSRVGAIAHDTIGATARSVRRGARRSSAAIDHVLHGAARIALLLISAATLACAIWIALRMAIPIA